MSLLNENCCVICNYETKLFFSKIFPTYPNSPFKKSKKIEYFKCINCGFVISETHKKMTVEQQNSLNLSWHHYFENNNGKKIVNQPPYLNQALTLLILAKNKILNLKDTLDYAAGYGTLSKILSKYFSTNINIFDKYVIDGSSKSAYLQENELKKYSLVINSAMFEHVLNRLSLNEVDHFVSDSGILMIHTVVCEKIPCDPNWFYLEPIVHTAFHTNKSMGLLMEQWGYEISIYSPQAKSWFLFKKNYPNLNELKEKICDINKEAQTDYFFYKKGFVDYWK
jgi:2-polyprenyl-3-methyl-5-hydroxy-6-metoxy-1,4-benzoquinol methylase